MTKQFLVDESDPIFGFPSLARFSWSTVKDKIKKNVTFSDERENALARFGFGVVGPAGSKRAPFYKKRGMKLCEGEEPPF